MNLDENAGVATAAHRGMAREAGAKGGAADAAFGGAAGAAVSGDLGMGSRVPECNVLADYRVLRKIKEIWLQKKPKFHYNLTRSAPILTRFAPIEKL